MYQVGISAVIKHNTGKGRNSDAGDKSSISDSVSG